MKRQLPFAVILLLILSTQQIQAQWDDGLWVGKQANNWIFYHDAGLNFNTSPPSIIPNANTTHPYWASEGEGGGTISDSEGNLLFSISADTIWNKNHQMMENGYGIYGGGQAAQSGLIVPEPGEDNLYYVFTKIRHNTSGPYPNVGTGLFGLFYSVVDMDLNNGLGKVIDKNNLLNTPNGDMLTAVHHANGEDVWVISHAGVGGNPGNPSNDFYAFLVSENGVASPVISTVGLTIDFSSGQMKASHDGSKIAYANGLSALVGSGIQCQVFDFNNATGQISNPIDLSMAMGSFNAYSLAFSPNDRFLYVTEGGFGIDFATLHQFDLEAGVQGDILASEVIISEMIPEAFFTLQTASNGKIYMTTAVDALDPASATGLSVINYPNNKGVAADFEFMTPNLGGMDSSIGLPGFIQSYFESGILHEGECAYEEVSFSTLRIPGIESIAWDFGDGEMGSGLTPTHVYNVPGTYTVMADITSNGALQTATTEITIVGGATAAQPEAFAVCNDGTGNPIFDLISQNTVILDGQDPVAYTVTYHISQSDAENNTNPILDPANYASSGGETIYARVTNNNSGCYATTQFELLVNPNVELPGGLELHTCSVFDLNLIAEQVEGGLTLSYHTTQSDAENGTNSITEVAAYEIMDREATIYLRAENEEGCVDVAPILLIRGGGDCIIPQGISPNGDAYNQNFDLSYLNIQSLEIFNRHGRSVYQKNHYTNQWFGQTDSGDELGTGTYFYVIKLEEGETFQNKNVLTGWVYVNRQVN